MRIAGAALSLASGASLAMAFSVGGAEKPAIAAEPVAAAFAVEATPGAEPAIVELPARDPENGGSPPTGADAPVSG